MPLLRIFLRGNIRLIGWFSSRYPWNKIMRKICSWFRGLFNCPPSPGVWSEILIQSLGETGPAKLFSVRISVVPHYIQYVTYYTNHYTVKPLFKIISTAKIRFWIRGWNDDCSSSLLSIYWQFSTAITSVNIPNISIF